MRQSCASARNGRTLSELGPMDGQISATMFFRCFPKERSVEVRCVTAMGEVLFGDFFAPNKTDEHPRLGIIAKTIQLEFCEFGASCDQSGVIPSIN